MPNRYGLTIRAAEAGDVEGLGALLRACGFAAPRERLSSALSAIRQQSGVMLLADDWGPPAGLVAVHWAATLSRDLKSACLSELFVDPDRRRAGVARLLLRRLRRRPARPDAAS